jgi:hypothetical protein
MRAATEVGPNEFREARDTADTLISARFRSYLPGRMLPMLIAKFRDDCTEAMGLPLPPLPQRPPVRSAKLDDLTTSEMTTLWGAVDALLERFTVCMGDPALPRLLAELRTSLLTERADRARIAGEVTASAKAS